MSISRGPCAYSKMEKEDPEEVSHRRAQFLIYKALERADRESQMRRPSFLRIRFCRLKMRIGKRLKTMRKGMLWTLSESSKVGAYKQKITKQIKRSCMRLFRLGESTEPTIPNLLI